MFVLIKSGKRIGTTIFPNVKQMKAAYDETGYTKIAPQILGFSGGVSPIAISSFYFFWQEREILLFIWGRKDLNLSGSLNEFYFFYCLYSFYCVSISIKLFRCMSEFKNFKTAFRGTFTWRICFSWTNLILMRAF